MVTESRTQNICNCPGLWSSHISETEMQHSPTGRPVVILFSENSRVLMGIFENIPSGELTMFQNDNMLYKSSAVTVKYPKECTGFMTKSALGVA